MSDAWIVAFVATPLTVLAMALAVLWFHNRWLRSIRERGGGEHLSSVNETDRLLLEILTELRAIRRTLDAQAREAA